jgi:hypothetical protein
MLIYPLNIVDLSIAFCKRLPGRVSAKSPRIRDFTPQPAQNGQNSTISAGEKHQNATDLGSCRFRRVCRIQRSTSCLVPCVAWGRWPPVRPLVETSMTGTGDGERDLKTMNIHEYPWIEWYLIDFNWGLLDLNGILMGFWDFNGCNRDSMGMYYSSWKMT